MGYNNRVKFLESLSVFAISFGVVFCAVCVAHAQEVSFVSNPVWLSSTKTTEGESVQASTVVTKQGVEAISGTVTFYANGKSLGTSDFSLPAGVGGVVLALTFVPEPGSYSVSAKITKAVSGGEVLEVVGEAKASGSLVVEADNDRDKIADAADSDDDNDGVSDADEKKAGTDPLKKEVAQSVPVPQVAGASAIADQAKAAGGVVFERAEDFRTDSAAYLERKIKEEEAARSLKKQETVLEEDLDATLVHPKSFTEQISDTSGILEGVKIQAYKAAHFVFDNVYVFYLVIIAFILWLLRKIWRRYSLN
jgi:hypothetical protein